MDFADYDVVERQITKFNKKINRRLEKEPFSDKSNTKFILTTLVLDYSPENTSTFALSSMQKKNRNDLSKHSVSGGKVFSIKPKKINFEEGGLLKKRQYIDVTTERLLLPELASNIVIVDILFNKVYPKIEEACIKEIAHYSKLSYSSHLIKVYLLNTTSFFEIESEQGDTIKDLKSTVIKMIEKDKDKDKRLSLNSRLSEDYDVFYHKEDAINELNGNIANANSNVNVNGNNNGNAIESKRSLHSIDDRHLLRMLKSKILSFEYKKEIESLKVIDVEEQEDKTNVRVYYTEGINAQMESEEFTISNKKTMNDLLIMIMKNKNLTCRNKDLYYFQVHCNEFILIQSRTSNDNDVIDNELPLSKIKENEFDLRLMMFPEF